MSLLTAEDVQALLSQFATTAMKDVLSDFGNVLREGIRDDLRGILASSQQAPPRPQASRAGSGAPTLDTKLVQGAIAAASSANHPDLHVPTCKLRSAGGSLAAADTPHATNEPSTSTQVEAPVEAPRKWEAAKAKMQKIRAVVPTTPMVARELRELGYFNGPPKPDDVQRFGSDDSKAGDFVRKMMVGGTEGEDDGTLLHSKSSDYRQLQEQCISKFVTGDIFEVVVLSVICLNALFIGAETNTTAAVRAEYLSRSEVFVYCERAFLAFFTVELVLRLYVFRCWFFRWNTPRGRHNPNFVWNVFDFTLVALQLSEYLLRLFVDLEKTVLGKATILRFLRVLRVARLLRMGKVLRFFRTLRTIVHSIVHAGALFIWALASLLLLYYLFGVYITEIVTDDLHVESPDPDLVENFGTVKASMLSLAKGSTGGADWGDLYGPLFQVSGPFAAYPFFVYLMFLTIVTMNVFTGIIFDNVQKRDQQENELELLSSAYEVFQSSDSQGQGTITKAAFQEKVKQKDLQKFFSTIDLDIQQAECLFDLLDMSNDGCISCGEFLRGCMRLQGGTKALDLLILSREVNQLFDGIASINKRNEEAAAVQRRLLLDQAVENQRLLRSLSSVRGNQAYYGHQSGGYMV